MHQKNRLCLFGDIFRTLSWALDTLKNFRVRLYVYVFFLMFQSVYQIYMTSRGGSIIDLAIEDNVEKLISTAALFAVLYALNVAITIICNRFGSKNYNNIYNDLELKVYQKIMDASWEGLTEYHSGDLITRLSSDIKTVAGNTSGLVPTMIAKLTLILGAGIYIVYLDYSMIFLALVIAPIVIVASRIFMGKIYRSEARIREIESQINSYNVETFSNIQAIKAFGLGRYFYKKMNDIEVERKNVDLRTNKFIMCSYATSYFAGIIGAGILITWMFHRVHDGYITFGALSVMTFLSFQIGTATEALLDLVPTIMAYIASAERVKKLLSIPDEPDAATSEEIDNLINESKGKGAGIHVKNMFFRYSDGHSIFENVSLDANPGELVALVGPSGEGKTTMLRIILGIVAAYKGRAYASVGDREFELGLKTRSVISYVPQGNTMMSGSIFENMRMVNEEATETQINEALSTACIYDYVKTLPEGLEFKLGENGRGLSEGQNQRLSIARALLKNAPILLMDEATSALDVATERRIIDNIRNKASEKTIIITTHRPTVLSMCDRVYRIADKKITELTENDIQKLLDEF